MAKRRSVMAGLGALATGSGAIFASGAFDSAIADSEADLRVIADAQLQVRSARNSEGSPIVGSLTEPNNTYVQDDGEEFDDDYDTFFADHVEGQINTRGQPSVGAVQINEGVNDDLAIRTAFSNRLDGSVSPLIEITNNADNSYDVGINYAADSGGDDGYGNDVQEGYSSSELSQKVVQAIYQFRLDGTEEDDGSGGEINKVADNAELSDGDLFSPDPFSDPDSDEIEDEKKVTLETGETIFVKLDYNTDNAGGDIGNLTGIINSAAAAGNGGIDDINPNLDLLNSIYVTAE